MTVPRPPEDRDAAGRVKDLDPGDARFVGLAEFNPVSTLVVTGETIAYANPATRALLGATSPDQVHGRSVYDFVEASQHELVRPRLEEVGSTGASQLERCVWQRLDGSLVDVEVRLAATTWGGETAIQILARDLPVEATLDHREARYRALFDSIDEGFCIVEVLFDERGQAQDYVFLEVNRSFEEQTGIRDAVGRRMREINPDHEAHWFEIYGRVATTRVPERFENPADALGHYYDVYAFSVGRPEAHQVAILFRDISAQKELEEKLRRLATRLARANERKDEFLAMLGHELRNPLAAVRYAVEVLKVGSGGDPRIERARLVVERQAGHMASLVDGLLEVSRIARGKVQVERTPLDLAALLEAAVSDRRAVAQGRGPTLALTLPEAPLWVSGDPVRLSQVLDNLIGNAFKFTEPEGRVTVSAEAEGAEAVIRVHDTGVGMAPELLEVVFEAFRQGDQDSARASGGLGLGLALAEGLVKLHDGTIHAHSAGVGQGAEFEIRLPRIAAPARPAAEGTTAAAAPRAILLVEDNADAAAALRDVLELRGHRVTHVETVPEGLAILRQGGVDVVLCDLGLPGLDGLTLAREVRADPALRDTPLVAVTGYGQPSDRERTAEAGFDDHLTKPVAPDRLEASILRLLRQGRKPA